VQLKSNLDNLEPGEFGFREGSGEWRRGGGGGGTHLGVKVEDLLGPERTLEAALAGPRRCQILLELLQRTQRRAARTATYKQTPFAFILFRIRGPSHTHASESRKRLKSLGAPRASSSFDREWYNETKQKKKKKNNETKEKRMEKRRKTKMESQRKLTKERSSTLKAWTKEPASKV
jgi:hypothetical protein